MASSVHLLILISALLIQTALSLNPLLSFCSNSQNFTANSPYDRNLKILLGELYIKTSLTGYGQGSFGQHPDRAYGLSLCRGDVSMKNCTACVVEASTEITKRCPKDKGGIIWYDNCYLKYSNDDFLGKVDDVYVFYLCNLKNVTTNAKDFSRKTEELFSKLSKNASETSSMFANGDVEVEEHGKIYEMVQCSRDLSRADCKKCLDDAVRELPRHCGGKVGGRAVGGSCNIRYEINPFLSR